MKKLFILAALLSTAQAALCMEATVIVNESGKYRVTRKLVYKDDDNKTIVLTDKEQETFLQLVRAGNAEKVSQMLATDQSLVNARTLREGRSALHVAALGYLIDSNIDCFTIFELLDKTDKFLILKAAVDKNGRSIPGLIRSKLAEAQNPTDGMKKRAAVLIDVLNGTVTHPIQHVLDVPTAEEQFLKDARKGNLQAVKEFLAKQANPKEFIDTTKDRREHRPALHRAAMGYLFGREASARQNCLEVFKYLLGLGANPLVIEENNKRNVADFIRHKSKKHGAVIAGLNDRAQELLNLIK